MIKFLFKCCAQGGGRGWQRNYQKPGALNEMKNLCKNFKGIKIIKNAGHWVQQEKPEDVAKEILKSVL